MKVLHFPIPVSRVRECLHKLGLWPLANAKNGRIYFTDIKESYCKTVLACHPDSREPTCSTTELPAVRDVVDAYRQLVSCFGKDESAQKYIDKNSLCEMGRFSPANPDYAGGRFKKFEHHDEWNGCLDDPLLGRPMSVKKVNFRSYPYEVKKPTRFSPRRKSTPSGTTVVQCDESFTYKSVHSVEDNGFWYSKDVFQPEEKIENSRKKA